MRHGSHVRADAGRRPTPRRSSSGRRYHADYATILRRTRTTRRRSRRPSPRGSPDPDDPIVRAPWDVVDLRRLRWGDPAADALARAFRAREATDGWTRRRRARGRLPGRDAPGRASTSTTTSRPLGKNARHEIRRKVRRAEAAGDVRLTDSRDPLADLEAFIDLHQKRWGEDGLFPPTPGGDAEPHVLPPAVRAVRRRRPAQARVPDGRRPADRRRRSLRDARRRSLLQRRRRPGGARPVARCGDGRALRASGRWSTGARRLDFLRGDEPYKYEWGAVTSRSAASWSDGPRTDDAPTRGIPVSTPVKRCALPGDRRIRVVEILATGTNGGAQEHLFNLLSRLDPAATTSGRRRCRDGQPSASCDAPASR